MNTTKKAYREYLNRTCAETLHRCGPYAQRSRGYGDYLYAQDREKFNVDYSAWKLTIDGMVLVMREAGKINGAEGGRAAAANMTPAERSERSRKAANARHAKSKGAKKP